MPRTFVLSLVALTLISGCQFFDADDTPPPAPTSTPTPPIAPTAPTPPTAPVAPPPVAPPDPPPLAAPQLDGAYELIWIEDGPSAPRQAMPDLLIQPLPNCLWARWGWTFASDGTLTVSNEMLCQAPPDIGRGHGVCRAEFTTGVAWVSGGFRLANPVATNARFALIESRGAARDTATVRCSVRVGALDVTLIDAVPGEAANRPTEVTLQRSDGGRIRLRAVTDPEVDHGAIIDRSQGG